MNVTKSSNHWKMLTIQYLKLVYTQLILTRNETVDVSNLPDSRVMTETTLLCGLSSPSVETCRWKLYLVTGVRSLAM